MNQRQEFSVTETFLRCNRIVVVALYESCLYVCTLKNAGLFQPKFGSNLDERKCWVKNAIKKCTVESESESWVQI